MKLRGRFLTLAVILMLTMAASAAMAADYKVGDVVWAEWVPNGWYHGKITKSCNVGWHVLFDDGDQKCCTPMQLAKDVVPAAADVKVGASVLSQWSDGKYYPGTVTAISGTMYSVQYDDGDKGQVTLQQLRLR